MIRIANTIQAGGITQTQIDSITAAIHSTTRPVAAFTLTPVQRQTNNIIDCGTKTGTKLYAALKHVFDHKEGHTVTFSLEVKERAEEMGWSTGQVIS